MGVGEEGKTANYESDIKLHDKLIKSGHWSTMEHCAKVPTVDEYRLYSDAKRKSNDYESGWFDNFRGFISYRSILEKS